MGADVTQFSNCGISLLQKAAFDNNTEVIKILTIFARNAPRKEQRRSYIDLKHKDKKGNTALHFACNAKAQEAVERLFTLGIDQRDLNRQNKKGDTPLHLLMRGSDSTAKFNIFWKLLRSGAYLHVKNAQD